MSRRLTFSFVKLVTDDFKAITWSLAVLSCLVRTAISRFLFSSAPWWQVTNIAKGTISVRTLVVSHKKFKTGHLRFFLPSLEPQQPWLWGRCPRRRPNDGLWLLLWLWLCLWSCFMLYGLRYIAERRKKHQPSTRLSSAFLADRLPPPLPLRLAASASWFGKSYWRLQR